MKTYTVRKVTVIQFLMVVYRNSVNLLCSSFSKVPDFCAGGPGFKPRVGRGICGQVALRSCFERRNFQLLAKTTDEKGSHVNNYDTQGRGGDQLAIIGQQLQVLKPRCSQNKAEKRHKPFLKFFSDGIDNLTIYVTYRKNLQFHVRVCIDGFYPLHLPALSHTVSLISVDI